MKNPFTISVLLSVSNTYAQNATEYPLKPSDIFRYKTRIILFCICGKPQNISSNKTIT